MATLKPGCILGLKRSTMVSNKVECCLLQLCFSFNMNSSLLWLFMMIFVVPPSALDACDGCVHSSSPWLGEKSRNASGFLTLVHFEMHPWLEPRLLLFVVCFVVWFLGGQMHTQSGFPLMKYFVSAVCFGSLSGCIIKFLPISLDIFLCNQADRMFL